MRSEEYFFRYAFPCSEVLLQLKRIDQEDYDSLEKMLLKGEVPSRSDLERIFPVAFERIKRLAGKMGRDYWDFDVISEYWLRDHNDVIDRGEGIYGVASESFKKLCRVNVADIVERKGDNLIVEYDGGKRVVSDVLVRDVNVGDKVRIHYGYAVEKV